MEKETLTSNTHYVYWFCITLDILLAILSYFVYGQNVTLALAFIALMLLYDLIVLFSFIPFAGIFVSGLLMWLWATPAIYTLTGLYGSWLISLVFWMDIAMGAFATIVTSLLIISAIAN